MADYLLVPKHRQDRLVHEKARTYAGKPLQWLRAYRDDLLADQELLAETELVRYFSLVFEALASGHSWRIADNPRWIAFQVNMRTQDVKRAIERLVDIGRIDRLAEAELVDGGGLQMRLTRDQHRELEGFSTGSQGRADPELTPSQPRPGVEPPPATPRSDAASRPLAASSQLAQTRQDVDQSLKTGLEGSQGERAVISNETPEVLNRLLAVAARGNEPSANFIRHEAQGLPEAAIVSVLESFLRKRPRPANPAGYVVNALRRQRAERNDPRAALRADPLSGPPEPMPYADPEPDVEPDV